MSNDQLYREIGKSGVKASAVGLGTWAIGGWMWGGTDEKQSIEAIRASLDAGITLIDTAPAYGLGNAERIVGEAIKGRREDAVIATKCGLVWHTNKGNYFFTQDDKPVHRYLGKDSIIHEVEESLKRLQTDYIDLYITHWQDATTPIEETVAALDELKRSGKIRAIGASNVNETELQAYIKTGKLDAIQERFSMIDREIETTLLPLAIPNSVATLSYSSLALGLLSGKIDPKREFSGDDQRKDNPRFSQKNREKVLEFANSINGIAESHEATIAQVVIAWTLTKPGVTFALCGARDVKQAEENAAAGRIRLTDQERQSIDASIKQHLSNLDE